MNRHHHGDPMRSVLAQSPLLLCDVRGAHTLLQDMICERPLGHDGPHQCGEWHWAQPEKQHAAIRRILAGMRSR